MERSSQERNLDSANYSGLGEKYFQRKSPPDKMNDHVVDGLRDKLQEAQVNEVASLKTQSAIKPSSKGNHDEMDGLRIKWQ